MARKKSKRYTGVYVQELKNGDKSYYITYKENQKDIWKKIGKHSEGIREVYCYQKRNEIISKIRLGEDLPHVAKSKKEKTNTLEKVAKRYYDYKDMYNKENKKTRSRVEKRIKEHIIANMSLCSITRAHIEDLQLKLQVNYMPATVNFLIEQIGSIFKWAISNEEAFKNPVIGIKKLKVNNARIRYLELEEIKKLKVTLENDDLLYCFILVALCTGGRLQTICNIKPQDIKDNDTIRLYDFKNESEYYGFLPGEAKKTIINYIEKKEITKNEYLFKTTKNQNYTNQYYYRKLQPIFDTLFNPEGTEPLNKVTIHTLRHTFASQLAINETPILTIKKLMNHQDINTTMRYAKLSKSSGIKHVNNLINNML